MLQFGEASTFASDLLYIVTTYARGPMKKELFAVLLALCELFFAAAPVLMPEPPTLVVCKS